MVEIRPSHRVSSMSSYAFAEVDAQVTRLKEQGVSPIDFGVGDPTSPTPRVVRQATQMAIDIRKSSGYPSYTGTREYRVTISEWMKKRFGMNLDPDTEISSTMGSKEAVFNFPEGLVDHGDYVIIPTPGYPPYARGALFAEGIPYFVPLLPENHFLPDLEDIPHKVLKRAKIMWINYPSNPCAVNAPLRFLEEVVEFGHKHNIIIAADEAYTEIYFTNNPPHSILETTKEGVLAFHSLSKRSAMTCYRTGWVAGDRRIVDIFKKVKTNIDSGTATFIQDGAIAALGDETHVEQLRKEYREKRDILVKALTRAGLPDCTPESTMYIWQRVPQGMSSVEFATKLLDPEVAIVTTPGAWLSDPAESNKNPGEGFVRFALVPGIEQTKEAAEHLRNLKL
ncbi:MAG: aminotransferase class I/II-fold pyridoxal phosphate-dependent enzyme [Candidatus Brocadiales bacterium]|nr:aminotransferase class I/II-fold pyridoxal phosphate-dependent enzyme [Candidatus Bathyanammoxibius sp.]